jgi:hypothetical protein
MILGLYCDEGACVVPRGRQDGVVQKTAEKSWSTRGIFSYPWEDGWIGFLGAAGVFVGDGGAFVGCPSFREK